jgi:hypothetical protein
MGEGEFYNSRSRSFNSSPSHFGWFLLFVLLSNRSTITHAHTQQVTDINDGSVVRAISECIPKSSGRNSTGKARSIRAQAMVGTQVIFPPPALNVDHYLPYVYIQQWNAIKNGSVV